MSLLYFWLMFLRLEVLNTAIELVHCPIMLTENYPWPSWDTFRHLIIFQKAQSHISMVFGLVSQIPQLLVTQKIFSGYTWHQLVRTCTSPYKYRTRYRIFDLFLSSPRAWLQRCFFFKFTMSTRLNQPATASSLTDTLKEIQESMRTLREDVNRLKASGSGPPSQEQSTTMPRINDQDPA